MEHHHVQWENSPEITIFNSLLYVYHSVTVFFNKCISCFSVKLTMATMAWNMAGTTDLAKVTMVRRLLVVSLGYVRIQ